ncbi:MAG: hypothetical protein CMH56_08685 [Myxococcales bacterium]|nr:hypothetical protein [Myxococcales bacterium]
MMMRWDDWEIIKGDGALGTCVLGADLKSVNEEVAVTYIKELLFEHRMLVFRDQTLTPLAHEQFSMQFGPLRKPPGRQCVASTNFLQQVIKREEDEYNFGGSWHADGSFQPHPPMATILQAIDLPKAGGDTLFADCVLAYERLSEDTQSKIADLMGIHRAHGITDPAKYSPGAAHKSPGVGTAVSHPVVGCHPHSKKKYLYVNPAFTRQIIGFSDAESDALIDELSMHIIKPETVYRHQWRAGDVVMWDNKTTQHCAVNDYGGTRREMHRSVVYEDLDVMETP